MDTQKAELNPTPAETESAQTNESGEISKLESRIDKNERIGDHPADIVAYDVKVLQFERRCELVRVLRHIGRIETAVLKNTAHASPVDRRCHDGQGRKYERYERGNNGARRRV